MWRVATREECNAEYRRQATVSTWIEPPMDSFSMEYRPYRSYGTMARAIVDENGCVRPAYFDEDEETIRFYLLDGGQRIGEPVVTMTIKEYLRLIGI